MLTARKIRKVSPISTLAQSLTFKMNMDNYLHAADCSFAYKNNGKSFYQNPAMEGALFSWVYHETRLFKREIMFNTYTKLFMVMK
jgi:hypothetical protein